MYFSDDDAAWTEKLKKKDHYLALGIDDVSLSVWEMPDEEIVKLPWQYVVDVDPGGSHRLDMETSVRFKARHPEGLTFSWSLAVEEREANGLGHYKLRTDLLVRVIRLLPERRRRDFQVYLRRSADSVLKKAWEYDAITQRQFHDAAVLRGLAEFEVAEATEPDEER